MDGSFPDSKGDKTMVVKCEDVWREISNYFEEDLDPALKLAMEEHFAHCTRCGSVRDGMRNVIELYGDKAAFILPAGFYPRLHNRLADQIEGRKISRRAWLVSVAVTGALAATAFRYGTRWIRAAAPLRDEPAGTAIAATSCGNRRRRQTVSCAGLPLHARKVPHGYARRSGSRGLHPMHPLHARRTSECRESCA